MNTPPYPHAARMSLQDVTVEFDGHKALSDVSFDVGAGTLMGVVGPNGSGKSTEQRAFAGPLPVRRGKVTLHRADQGREIASLSTCAYGVWVCGTIALL